MSRLSWRWRVWVALLLGAAALAAFGDKSPKDAVVAPTSGARSAAVPASTGKAATPTHHDALAVPVDREVLYANQADRTTRRDLFAPPAAAAPPPTPIPVLTPPVEPPSPATLFAVIGKKLEEGQWEVFLTRGPLTLIVREGQVIDGEFRVDRIAPPEMILTQLSTGQPTTLGIGDAR